MPDDTRARTDTLFRTGHNVTAIANARRVAFLVDAEDYFRQFMRAARRAQRSILIVGWDFDSRTRLDVEGGKPVLLGEFLNGLAEARRELRIRILDWDYPLIFGTDREIPPTLLVSWQPHRRVDFRFDDTHPVAGSHHQKIVVIDDCIAFVGGLDLTGKRWDTREHAPGDPRRVFNGEPYPPMHDVMMAVDADAAAAVAKIARGRWRDATGEVLKPARCSGDPWPPELAAALRDARVGFSRTSPATDDNPGTHEVERLYLDMIAAARDYIYIENQYFTSSTITDALAARLREPEGPEIVLLTRLLSHGWLEELTMTTLRNRYVRELSAADAHGRFHAFNPHIPGLTEGTCIDLHSKVMIVDDEWLRIGSANLSNRSMGMDTECDAVIEAQGDAGTRRAIAAFRDELLAEHLGADAASVAKAIAAEGSIARAIESLNTGSRCLQRLETPEVAETKLTVAEVGDPDAPITFERIVRRISPESSPAESTTRFPLKRALGLLAAAIVGMLALAFAWTHSPLAQWVTKDNAMALAHGFAGHWWAPLVLALAYTPGSYIMFPRWLLTMTAVLAFGPWKGFVIANVGCELAALATFLPGRLVRRETVQRIAGAKLNPIARFIQRRGLLAVTAIRLVPIAPFPVVNFVMGALRVRVRHLVGGTFFGMLPGMLTTTVLSDQLAAWLEQPARFSMWIVAGAIAFFALVAFLGQRYLRPR